jgi:hypothetical protein
MKIKCLSLVSVTSALMMILSGCSSASVPEITTASTPSVTQGSTCSTLGEIAKIPNEDSYLECRYNRDGTMAFVRLTGITAASTNIQGLADINQCKLQDLRPDYGMGGRMSTQNTSFPLRNPNIPPNGNIQIGIVPIDFADSPAEVGVKELMSGHLKDVDNWLEFTTNGVTKYTWHMPENWLRMPLESQFYQFGKQNVSSDGGYIKVSDQLQETSDMATQIFSAAEQFLNLSEMDYVWVVLPPTTTNVDWGLSGTAIPVKTSTSQYSLHMYGMANILWNEQTKVVPTYSIMLHELLHAHGASQHAPGNEYALHLGNSIGTVMGAWDSFIMGWRPDSAFACVDSSTLTELEIELTPLDHKQRGFKAAIIRLSDNEAIVIESRRKGPFSHDWVDGAAFVTAYLVDSSKLSLRFDGDNERVKDYFSYYLEINEPHEKMLNYGQPLVNMMGPQFEYFSVRHVGLTGDVFEYGGLSIEVTNQSDTDTVRVTKIG